jgi:hypothetical protein
MSDAQRVSLAAIFLSVTVPLTLLACGGSKPPESPADETASGGDAGEATGDNSASPALPSAAPADSSAAASSSSSSSSSAAPADSAAAAPPSAPPFGGTDCGKCVDKTCAHQAAACGKNTDCQATVDAIHSCGSDTGAAACIDSATPPTAAKPKKLATAFQACAKKAITKACKSKCP